MSFVNEIGEAQRVYKDILNGYTSVKTGGKTYFVKHLSDIDHGFINEYRQECYNSALEKGIQTEKQQIKMLHEQDVWTKKDESEFYRLKQEINTLNNTKRKLALKRQIASIDRDIERVQTRLSELEDTRNELVGITCENYSNKKVNEYYVFASIYKDKELTEKIHTLEEYEEMSPSEISDLVEISNAGLINLNEKFIKRIAASPFFLNSIMICKDNPMIFWGKPVSLLTNYQQSLFSAALRFKRVIEDKGDVPPESETLQEIVDWYENEVTINAGDSNSQTQNTEKTSTVFGADKDELKKLTKADDSAMDLHAAAAARQKEREKETGIKHGVLTLHDMLKIHGEL